MFLYPEVACNCIWLLRVHLLCCTNLSVIFLIISVYTSELLTVLEEKLQRFVNIVLCETYTVVVVQ